MSRLLLNGCKKNLASSSSWRTSASKQQSNAKSAATTVTVSSNQNNRYSQLILSNRNTQCRHNLLIQSFTSSILRPFTTAAATPKPTSSNSNQSESKTMGDVFLDNLGKVFLSAIGLIIAALTRSSMATTNRNNLRTAIEEQSALDPFEIDDLRFANEDLDRRVFELILEGVEREFGGFGVNGGASGGANGGANGGPKVDYREFVSVVMNVMKGIKGEGFTIQLGHLLDRVVVSLLNTQHTNENTTTTTTTIQSTDSSQNTVSQSQDFDQDGKIDLSLLLVALCLCLHGNVRDRVEILFEIMRQKQSTNDNSNCNNSIENDATTTDESVNAVNKEYVIEMIGHLQKTCQLVPDAQIVESDTKYPVQKYKVGTPLELTDFGIEMKKDELTERALEKNIHVSKWSCDDFHHLLRSRAVCAWGECYVKKKSLTE